MVSKIFLCFECGAKNRIPESRDVIEATCGKCGAALLASKSNSAQQQHRSPNRHQSEPKTPPNLKTHMEDSGAYSGFLRKAVVVVVLLAGGYYLFGRDQIPKRSEPSSIAASISEALADQTPEVLPAPVFQGPGIIDNFTGRTGQNPFEIATRSGENYYIKLVDASTGTDRIGIFVIGGQRLEVNVPAGRYKMRYASGETWRGIEHLFGPNDMTSYSASSDIFDFGLINGRYRGYTVELIRQTGGNMNTHGISESQF